MAWWCAASLREEGGGEGSGRWSLYLITSQIQVLTLCVLCIKVTLRVTLNQIAAQLSHPGTIVLFRSWRCRVPDSPGTLHGALERWGVSGFLSTMGTKHNMTNTPSQGMVDTIVSKGQPGNKEIATSLTRCHFSHWPWLLLSAVRNSQVPRFQY